MSTCLRGMCFFNFHICQAVCVSTLFRQCAVQFGFGSVLVWWSTLFQLVRSWCAGWGAGGAEVQVELRPRCRCSSGQSAGWVQGLLQVELRRPCRWSSGQWAGSGPWYSAGGAGAGEQVELRPRCRCSTGLGAGVAQGLVQRRCRWSSGQGAGGCS